jgi:geranylgeranyl diphosphate synthase type II
VKTSASDLQTWLGERRRDIDASLERFLPSAQRAPAAVCEAMRYSVLAGGKRLRPMLALAAAEATAEAIGCRTVDAATLAMPAACAVEMIHTYSLVHDDLPAMDNDTLRRGRPTAHVVFGEGMAILSGDGLLTEAFGLLAREPATSTAISPDELAQRKLTVLSIVADAAGAAGMVGGQALDLQAVTAGASGIDGDSLRRMHSRKTGALIRAAASAGAVMAGAPRELLEAIDTYADNLGLAFQIVDDILDVEGASADLGKTAGKDAAAGKPTYPALFGLAESRKLAGDCSNHALAALNRVGLRGQLPAIVQWVVSRTN